MWCVRDVIDGVSCDASTPSTPLGLSSTALGAELLMIEHSWWVIAALRKTAEWKRLLIYTAPLLVSLRNGRSVSHNTDVLSNERVSRALCCHAHSLDIDYFMSTINWLSSRLTVLTSVDDVASHTRPLVPQSCKDDCESLWKSLKFDPSPRKYGLTDRPQNLHRWLRPGYLPCAKFCADPTRVFSPHMGEI